MISTFEATAIWMIKRPIESSLWFSRTTFYKWDSRNSKLQEHMPTDCVHLIGSFFDDLRVSETTEFNLNVVFRPLFWPLACQRN